MSVLENKLTLFNPIKEYWEFIGCKDINVYEETNKILSENKLINKYNKHIDNACYHSINYYENINLLTCINLSKKESYDYYVNNMKYTHILYGIKTKNIKFNLLLKILYQIKYQYVKSYDELVCTINKDYPFFEKYDNEYIEVNILLLISRKNDTFVLEEKNNCILFYSNNLYQKKIISSIFYNENSIKFLEKQNLEKVLSFDFKDNLKEFHNLKDEIFNYDYLTQENIMITSSTILMLLGMRKNNDTDVYVDKVKNGDKIIDTFSKIKNVDFQVKNTDKWPMYWDKWLDEWAQKCGAKYFEEILGFHDYHFYYCGIKFMDLDVDIQRRITRSRPASCTDLIMLNKTYNLNITLPKIPETYFEYKGVETLKEKEKDKLLEEGAIYNPDNREYKIEKKTNITVFIKRMQDYFKTRYKNDLSSDQIKDLFGMKKKIKIKIKK